MKAVLKVNLIPILILLFSSCSDDKSRLTSAIEDSWSMIEDQIEDSAEETLEELADNPDELYKGDCEADYMSFGNIYTLTIPMNYSAHAAVGLLFGDEARELFSLIDDAGRNSRSKADVKKLIHKNLNSSWSEMMTALIVLDGEFDYDFETSDLLNSSYEFDSKDLYKILEGEDYFKGVYGDYLPSEAELANMRDNY